MISWKSNFPTITVIEIYVIFPRSTEHILMLLNPPTSTSSSNSSSSNPPPPPVTATEAILYFGGPLQHATIMDCPHGYGIMFKCLHPRKMMIQHEWTFHQLFHRVSEVLDYGDRKQITEITYRRPIRVIQQRLIYDSVEIKNDEDVKQMIKRWHKTLQLKSNVQRCHTWAKIELFVQTRTLRLPTPEEQIRDLNDSMYKDHHGRIVSTLNNLPI